VVRIRLRRMGAKKKPFYRIVVSDKRSPRDGRFIETIGTYDPLTQPETVSLKHARAAHWLGVGAQPSEAVARLLKTASLLDEQGKPVPYEVAPADAAPVEAVAEKPLPVTEAVAPVESEPVDAVEEAAAVVEEPVVEASIGDAVQEVVAEQAVAEQPVAEEAESEPSENDA